MIAIDSTKTKVANNIPETPCLSLRPKEAAKALGICERTLWEMTQRGVVPHIRLSEKIILYSVDSLRTWLQQQAQNIEK
jgi:predicted DNA-binding transcriptional regulator AlpA